MLTLLDFLKPEPSRIAHCGWEIGASNARNDRTSDDVQLPRMLRRRVAQREDFQLHQRPTIGLSNLNYNPGSAAFGADAAGAGTDDFVAAAMRADDVHEHVAKDS